MPEQATRADDRRFRWLALAITGGTAVLLVSYGARAGWQALAALPRAAGPVWISKLAIFSGALESNPYDPWTLGLVAWVLDLVVSLTLLAGLPQLERLPVTGPYLLRTRRRAVATLLRYPRLERMAIVAITFFVFLPVPGSGSVFGTLVGQIAGLSRTVTLCVVGVGSGLAALVFASAAHVVGANWEKIAQSPWASLAGLAMLLALFWYAWRRVRRELSRA